MLGSCLHTLQTYTIDVIGVTTPLSGITDTEGANRASAPPEANTAFGEEPIGEKLAGVA